ncbi:MAG: hypothetical protein AAGA48_22275 [Myxococcota bacterium]
MNRLALVLFAFGCSNGDDESETMDTGITEVENAFPLPEDIDTIDWQSVFQEAINLVKTVNTQAVWRGHLATMQRREVGCPDFWTGEFTVGAQTVGEVDGIAWYDDCRMQSGLYYDGWLGWSANVVEEGDPDTFEGRTSDADRVIEGDALVGNDDGVLLEFDGEARDSFYRLDAYGFERFVYSSQVDGTLTGTDVFEGTTTPEGFRTDLFMTISGGDVDSFEARGNAYLFTPQLQGRFDSIQVDMELVGPTGASPDDCTLEPVGWMGVRDPDAYWYDVVFLPRFREDVSEDPYQNDALSSCDGCGRLYIQGIEQQGIDVCVDFSFLFDGEFPLPDADEYVLPFHGL